MPNWISFYFLSIFTLCYYIIPSSEAAETKLVTFHFYDHNMKKTTITKDKLATEGKALVSPSKRVYILIHSQNRDCEEFEKNLTPVLAKEENNLICFDYPYHLNYKVAVPETSAVAAEYTAIATLGITGKVFCIGFELGGHVCTQFAEKFNKPTQMYVTLLNPLNLPEAGSAAKTILGTYKSKCVSECYHSNDGGGFSIYGISKPIAGYDFFINGGKLQDNCFGDDRVCSSKRSILVYIFGKQHPEKKLRTLYCKDDMNGIWYNGKGCPAADSRIKPGRIEELPSSLHGAYWIEATSRQIGYSKKNTVFMASDAENSDNDYNQNNNGNSNQLKFEFFFNFILIIIFYLKIV